jgi:hypothetical protein
MLVDFFPLLQTVNFSRHRRKADRNKLLTPWHRVAVPKFTTIILCYIS